MTENAEIVLINYTELVFVCAGVFWELMLRHERFQMLPTRIMCLGMQVRRHLNSCFFPPFYGLQEQIQIFPTDPPVFSILESAVLGQDRL